MASLPPAAVAYLLLAVYLGVAVALAWLVDRFAFAVVRAATRRTATDLDDIMVEALHRPLVVVLTIVFAHLMAGLAWTQERVPAAAIAAFRRFEVALVVLAVAYGIVRVVRALLRRPTTRFGRLHAVSTLAARLVAVLVYTVAFLVVLDQYGISITPILTSLGIAGLAVALALQDTLANFFAGMWIQTGRALRPGHFVRIEELALEGTIVEVGWRTTQIRTPSNSLILVPNAKFAQSVVIDHDLPAPDVSTGVGVVVGYEADPDQVEAALAEEVAAARKELAPLRPDPPILRLSGLREGGMEFTVYVTVASQADAGLVQSGLRKRFLKRLAADGVRVASTARVLVRSDQEGAGTASGTGHGRAAGGGKAGARKE